MNTQYNLEEYRTELRSTVCSLGIERLPNDSPCAPLGKGCGIERHLASLVNTCRSTDSVVIDPYIEKIHDTISVDCDYKERPGCPGPLDYLLQLAVAAGGKSGAPQNAASVRNVGSPAVVSSHP
jgi:hypothetical protein